MGISKQCYRVVGLLLFVLYSMPGILHAQYTNVWAFGKNAGIDFNQDPPQAIHTAINTNEGCATICDAKGQLLFYTDGTKVWNKDHMVMPGGSNLPGLPVNITASTEQGAVIVPQPGSDKRYYIFSLSSSEHFARYRGRLYYSIIDMDLDNGMGDVVANERGKVLDSGLIEFMTAVTGEHCNYWLLVGSGPMPLKAYSIHSGGIASSPVLSPGIAPLHAETSVFAHIDIAPDRSKLIINRMYNTPEALLCQFDASTGMASDPILLSGAEEGAYASCFSPDGSKLYMGVLGVFGGADRRPFMAQFDLAVYDSASICSSLTIVDQTHAYLGGMRRAPNGKIYSVPGGAASLSVINLPNLKGKDCDFKPLGFPLLAGTSVNLGLPNHATIIERVQVSSKIYDTAFCVATHRLKAIDTTGEDYTWEDGRMGSSRLITQSGTYWVSYQGKQDSSCIFKENIDTFRVLFADSKIYSSSTHLKARCLADTQLLQPAVPFLSTYLWDDGSSGEQRKILQSGLYIVRYRIDSLCVDYVDSFRVSFPLRNEALSFEVDSVICLGDPVIFANTSGPGFDRFNWFFGDHQGSEERDPLHQYRQSGQYRVTLTGNIGGNCFETTQATIIVDSIVPVTFFIDKTKACVGDPVQIRHQLSAPSIRQLSWNWGDGSFLVAEPGEQIFHHAYDDEGIKVIALEGQFRACPDLVCFDTLRILAAPLIDLGTPAGICAEGRAILLKNIYQPHQDNNYYQWSTGQTTSSIEVKQAGTYSVRVSHPIWDCVGTASIVIQKDCFVQAPNAFTPNGDGVNDYFFPRQLLTTGARKFYMQVFNRWGHLVFETHRLAGRGWDGRYNGIEQPAGVFLYKIQAEMNNGATENLEGSVTLIR